MSVSFHVLIGSELTLFSRGVHLEIDSLRLNLHLVLIQKYKINYFPIFLLSSSSPTLFSQTSKAPKNPRTKSKIKTDRIGNPNPKIKKIHSNHRLGRMAWVDELGPQAVLGEVVANRFGYVVEEVAKS